MTVPFQKLPEGTKITAFKHCNKPLVMVIGQIDNDPDDSNYQTYAECQVCNLLLLVKAGPWDDVKSFLASGVKH